MQVLKWIIAISLLLLAVWLSALNWGVFWKRHVRGVATSSWIPFLGGSIGVVGLLSMPIPSAATWWWVPLLLDWGCVPGIGYSIYYHLTRPHTK